MGLFLNSRIPYDSYKATASDKYFVDKTALIAELIPALGRNQRFFCITRPRRFGKAGPHFKSGGSLYRFD